MAVDQVQGVAEVRPRQGAATSGCRAITRARSRSATSASARSQLRRRERNLRGTKQRSTSIESALRGPCEPVAPVSVRLVQNIILNPKPHRSLAAGDRARDLPERRAEERAVRVVEVRRVGDVEDVDAELALDLPEREQLRDRGVEVDVRRTVERRRCAARCRTCSRAGDENTDVSNHSAPGPMPPSTCRRPADVRALRVARRVERRRCDIVMPIGDPDCAEKMPLTCQPPRIVAAAARRAATCDPARPAADTGSSRPGCAGDPGRCAPSSARCRPASRSSVLLSPLT